MAYYSKFSVRSSIGCIRAVWSPLYKPSRPQHASEGRRMLGCKAVMVAATGQHHGKTTVTLGMVASLLDRGVKVAYQKPVGQQTVPVMCNGEELQIDRDVDIFKYVWPQLIGNYSDCSPVAFPPGFTRMVLDKEVNSKELRKRCIDSFHRIKDESEFVVVEGTGHIGVGSIIDLNNAQVAAALGIDVVIVAPGGLGVSFDVLACNYAVLKEHGVRLKGVVLNKVDPSKQEMNVNYYRKALDQWGVPLLGVVPQDPTLSLVPMQSYAKLLKADFVAAKRHELRYFHHTRLIMTPNDVTDAPFEPSSLAIIHSARREILQAFIQQHEDHRTEQMGEDLGGGLIVVGPERIPDEIIAALEQAGIPTLFVQKTDYDGTGFTMIERVLGYTHKHHRVDIPRILRTCSHVDASIDLDAIIS